MKRKEAEETKKIYQSIYSKNIELVKTMKEITNEFLDQKLDYAIGKIDDVKKQIDNNLISRDYFELRIQPLEQSKRIVFGFIALLLTTFALALIGFIFVNK
jgi:hypothetical protein